MFVVKDSIREPLYAVVPYFNPWRWKSREKHAVRTLKHFHDSGVVIYLVEIAFNRRDFVFADCGMHGTLANCGFLGTDDRLRHRYIGLRTEDELWLKESAINRGVQELPYDWQQVIWPDADIQFIRPNWVGECIHKLQHYKFLQPFSQARDVGPNYELLPANYPSASGPSFMRAYYDGLLPSSVGRDVAKIEADLKQLTADVAQLKQDLKPYNYPGSNWPGLVWACTRQAWDEVGGLFDAAIWGGGDHFMAHALTEKSRSSQYTNAHPNYRSLLVEWEDRCRRHIRRNVGVMEGSVLHFFHGRKSQRMYWEKEKLVKKVLFNPLRHLKRDSQGIWQLHDDGSDAYIHFRDQMRLIAKMRNEDATEL